MGTGTVVSVSATTLQVLVRGTTITAAYVAQYTTPLVGDLVAFMRQDSTWLVLGRLAGVGQNQVLNFSFEDDGDSGSTPSNWNVANIAGAGTARRSEEHTSELQSHVNLVCRLLLEKKKYE